MKPFKPHDIKTRKTKQQTKSFTILGEMYKKTVRVKERRKKKEGRKRGERREGRNDGKRGERKGKE